MAFSNTTFRGDLNSFVQQAAQASELLIGLKVAPVAPVSIRAGQYPRFTTALSLLQSDIVGERAQGSSYARANRKFEQAVYDCQEYGVEELVDDAYAQEFARFFEAESTAAKQGAHNLLLGHERRVAAVAMNTNNFTATNSAVAYTQANLATADFAKDVQARVEELNSNGVMPNAIVLSDTVFNYVTRTTLLQNFIKPYSAGASVLTRSVVANAFREAFGIENLLIGSVAYNASKTSTASLTKVWGNAYVWVGNITAGLPSAGGALRTFAWTQDGGEFVTESYREEQRRSTVIRVRHNVDEAVVDTTAARLITTQYA